MRLAVLLATLALPCAFGQIGRGLLLPQTEKLEGVVVDANGQPVSNVEIAHTGDRRHFYKTDDKGKFELSTNAPEIVFRKPGFESELRQTEKGSTARIALRKLPDTAIFPPCLAGRRYLTVEGWGAHINFRRLPEIQTSAQSSDADYGVRHYYVKNASDKGIRHGAGPMWGSEPLDSDVWRSTAYHENVYKLRGGFRLIDARGEMSNGTLWRTLAGVGETASYSGIDVATATILDRFLDTACWK